MRPSRATTTSPLLSAPSASWTGVTACSYWSRKFAVAHSPPPADPVLIRATPDCTRNRPHRARHARWGRGARRGSPLVQKPALHRDKLGGGGTAPRGAAGAKACAPPRQARWGRGARCDTPLVQKPALHRDKLGGGGDRATR